MLLGVGEAGSHACARSHSGGCLPTAPLPSNRAPAHTGHPCRAVQITAELEQHDEKATGPDWATATCTCPFAAGNNLCKHVIALLLARLDRKRAWRPACRHGPAPLPGLTAEAAAPAGAGATAASAPAAAGKAAAPLRAGATAISAPIVAGEAAASAPAAGEAAPRVPAPLAAAPQASSVLLPGSLATQGGKRKRVLPGSLGAAAG